MAWAEDGSLLWLRSPVPSDITLRIDPAMPEDDGYRIDGRTVTARTALGLLYGKYALLRGEQGESHPFFKLRILNHWDNLDGSVERGYAGNSIFWAIQNSDVPVHNNQGSGGGLDTVLISRYGEACASIGINGTVLNNVNASPKILTGGYLKKIRRVAEILRPWGIRVYLSVNFGSPKALGELKTADPLNPKVKRWWQKKAAEIYNQIPDFGGFLVKANSEGQPGPFDYGRTHADGANMLADALKPFGGIVMWRSFVYGGRHKGEDRVKQAASEFAPLDGLFRDNVILQSKNGPLDFQPREPYAPIFDHMSRTPQMAELQITQEYLGQSRHLVFLAPMWQEFFSYVSPDRLVGLAGVANIGTDTNWCGHHFSQANWYAFGRLAWNPALSSEQIAAEWLRLTFGPVHPAPSAVPCDETGLAVLYPRLLSLLVRSREACVDYMMPLGLHHIFRFDHHMGPDPGGFRDDYPIEWCPVYYHRANRDSIGVDRSSSGTGATGQYREPYRSIYDNLASCPLEFLLWFHRLPWSYPIRQTGRTLWQEMSYRYNRGVAEVDSLASIWQQARPYIDEQRWQEVDERLRFQQQDARLWRDTCLKYFGQLQDAP